MEAAEIARRLRSEEPLDRVIVKVFQETCGIKVSKGDACRIADVFSSDDEIVPD